MFLRIFAKTLKINLDDYGVAIVKASGANSIFPLAYLFEKFNIQPILIFDKDKYDEYQRGNKDQDITHFKDYMFVTQTKCFDSEIVFNLYNDDGIEVLKVIQNDYRCNIIQRSSVAKLNKQYALNPPLEEQDYQFASYQYPDEILKYMYVSFFQNNKTVVFGECIGERCPEVCIPECYKNAILKAVE